MKDNKAFEKYRQRLVKESVLKSLLLGIAIGCVALVLTGFFCWLADYKPGLFIALAAFVAVTAAVTPLFYYLRFRPTAKQIACRMDALGLEERVITMNELENDNSFIARLQGEDTMRVLRSVDHMLLKVAISAAIIVPVAIACFFGAGMTTVSALHLAGVIPGGIEALTPAYVPHVYTVSYSVEEGGEGSIIYWTGDWSVETPVEGSEQVKEGQDAKAVYAVPADDWVFVIWSDGVRDPYRQDTLVSKDIVVQAIFEPMEGDPEDGEEEGEGGGENKGDQQQDTEEQGNEKQEGEPQPSDSNSDEDGEESDEQQEQSTPTGDPTGDPEASGMRDQSNQQIVDGDTYYGDEFDQAYDDAKDRVESDDNIPDDLKQHILDYYESLQTSGSGEGGD